MKDTSHDNIQLECARRRRAGPAALERPLEGITEETGDRRPRRTFTEQQRAKLIETGRKYGLQPGHRLQSTAP